MARAQVTGRAAGGGGFIAAQRFGLMKLIELGLLWLRTPLPIAWSGQDQGLRRHPHDPREPTRCCVAPCATACRGFWEPPRCRSRSPRSATRSVFAKPSSSEFRRRHASTGFAVPAALGVQEAGFIIAAARLRCPARIGHRLVDGEAAARAGFRASPAWSPGNGAKDPPSRWLATDRDRDGWSRPNTARSRSTDGRRWIKE